MKTMNGITNELLGRKAEKNWRTLCGVLLLGALAAFFAGVSKDAQAQFVIDKLQIPGDNVILNDQGDPTNNYSLLREGDTSIRVTPESGWPNGVNLSFFFGGNSITANIGADADDSPTPGQTTPFTSGNEVTVTGGAFTVGGNVIWSGSFTVNSSTFNTTTGNELSFNGDFTNSTGSTLAVGGSRTGYLVLGAPSPSVSHVNNGIIRLDTGSLKITGNIGGTIVLTDSNNTRGRLHWDNSTNFSGIIAGVGRIMLETGGTFTGEWSAADITVDGNGLYNTLSLRGVGGALNGLSITNTAEVVVSDQSDVGSTSISLSNGAFSKAATTSSLSIGNSFETISNGVLSSDNNTLYGNWRDNADNTYDLGDRFVINGTITGSGTVHINGWESITVPRTGNGTVVLTGTNTSTGSRNFVIHTGVLEVTNQNNLGSSTSFDGYRRNVTIGDALNERAVLRFSDTGSKNTTISHDIVLANSEATIEVFTIDDSDVKTPENPNSGITVVDASTSDAERLTVQLNGQISGSGSLNKAGDGTLILGYENNTYQGNTNIWHGTLSISNRNQISNTGSLVIGEEKADDPNHGFRPVFQTTLDPTKFGLTNNIIIGAGVQINQMNSVVRTLGEGNRTTFTSAVTTLGSSHSTQLNKQGAGTLVLQGDGRWGFNNTGSTKIYEGTLEITRSGNLAKGDIFLGVRDDNLDDWKDIELEDEYKAVLRLTDNNATLGNTIIIGSQNAAYIDVDADWVLTLEGRLMEDPFNSDLNKSGTGTLVLGGANNSYTGWSRVLEGTLKTTVADNMMASEGVDLVGAYTTFQMGADQTIKNLRGIDPNEQDASGNPKPVTDWNPSQWTRTVDMGTHNLTVTSTIEDISLERPGNLLHGNIISEKGAVLSKQGATKSTLAAGFDGYQGAFDIQSGSIRTLTDTTITGLSGRTGTTLDLFGKELTIDIDALNHYSGTIISQWPTSGNGVTPADYGTLIKKGAGTLQTSFQVVYGGITNERFQGNVTLENGKIVSDSDFQMAKDGTLTFVVPTSGDILIFDISKHKADFSSPTHLSVLLDDTTGWDTPNGSKTVARILGNDQSDYSGLTPMRNNSLFYSIGKREIPWNGRKDLDVLTEVTGFGGVGGTFNQSAVGHNLDGIRVTDLSGNPLAEVIRQLWEMGNNLDPNERDEVEAKIRGVYDQLSGDAIANATFMGLDSPWKRPFDRLNLDSQMVYVQPQQAAYRGQAIANMRNLWFTPTYQGVVARSDGNARGFKIERPGYQLGWDKRVAQNASVGLMLGYSAPTLHQNQDIVNCSDFQVGLYGGAMVGYYVEVKGYMGFGHQNFKSSRTIDLRSIDMSTQTGHATFDGDTFNFSLEVARPLFLGFAVMRPTIGLDSEHAFRYSFQESGDSVALRYDRSSISRTRARFGLSLETCTLERAIFSGRLGYSALLGGHDYAQTTAQFVNLHAAPQTIRSVAVGKSYFDAGVGCRYFLNPSKTLSLVADYDASVANRWAEHRGVVGFVFIY